MVCAFDLLKCLLEAAGYVFGRKIFENIFMYDGRYACIEISEAIIIYSQGGNRI